LPLVLNNISKYKKILANVKIQLFYENVSGVFHYVRCVQRAGWTGVIMSIVNFSNPLQEGSVYNNFAAGICWVPVTYYMLCATAWDIHKFRAKFYWQRLELSTYRVAEKSRMVELNCRIVLGEIKDYLKKEQAYLFLGFDPCPPPNSATDTTTHQTQMVPKTKRELVIRTSL
jgi:hypothetical protein